MATTLQNLGITFPDLTVQTTAAVQDFASGTRMAFQQSTIPTGWTLDTSAAVNDSVLRIVTGTAGSGGSTAFSTFNGQTSTNAYTLASADIPSHSHVQQLNGADVYSSYGTSYHVSGTYYGPYGTVAALATLAAGGGLGHSHSMTNNIKYYQFILGSKN